MKAKKTIVQRFSQNLRPGISYEQVQAISEDLDKEDLVVYVLLTQAACKIQKAFRSHIARKKFAQEKQEIRVELETELEEARSCRAQIRSIENPTGMSSLVNQILSSIPSDSKENSPERGSEGATNAAVPRLN